MTLIYISVFAINEHHELNTPQEMAAECLENLEFQGDTWMDALDKAYDWLRVNRRDGFVYHVWC